MPLAQREPRASARALPVDPVPNGFALFEDGPFLQVLRRVHWLGPCAATLTGRVLATAALTWCALFALSIHDGLAFKGVALPFIRDIQTHARLLMALPLYIVSAHMAHLATTEALGQFVTQGIVRVQDRDKFTGILQDASRWNHSPVLRLAIIAIIVVFGRGLWMHALATSQPSSWYSESVTSHAARTLAGYWMVVVVNPIVQYVHALWILRLLMYAAMLARIASLDLHLVATHPDRAGGIGFLGVRMYGFAGFIVAEGAAAAGVLANHIFHEGGALPQFKVDVAVAALVVAVMVLGPLCVFIPKLLQVRWRGCDEYGAVASRYVRRFETAWVRGKADAEGRELLGASDIQSLADMANSFDVVDRMRAVPFSNMVAIAVPALFLLPIAPLLLTVYPAEELLHGVIGALIG